MRRRVTPALVLFCACLAALLAVPGQQVALVAFASVAAAGAAIPLLASGPRGLRRAGLLAAAAAGGLALGALSLSRIAVAREAGALPVPPGEVVSFTGVLRADSLLSRDGDAVLRVRVREVATRRGIVAAVDADVLLLVRGDWRFSAGERITAATGLAPFDGGGRERWVAGTRRDQVRGRGFASPLMALRARLRGIVHRAVAGVGYPASALLEALLVGAREDVPGELAEGFRRTGSLHVLSLSGLHAGIVFAVVALLLRPLGSRLAAFLTGTVFLGFYLFLAGPMPALARAVVMLVVGGAARLADRDEEPLNLLALSGIVIVAVDPFAAATLSFQLSFLGLAGLLALGPSIARPLEGRLPGWLGAALGASAGAQLATLPVVLLAFGSWFPAGILAALPLVPLVAVYLWLGLAWLALFPVLGTFLAAPAAWVFSALYRIIAVTNGALAEVPGLVVTPGAAAGWAAASAVLVTALALALPRGGRRTAVSALTGPGKGIAWAR